MTNLAALPSGTELVSDYRIDQVLGAGGFGITYLAHEMALDRRVTIKEYFPTDYAARAGSLEAAPRSQDCAGDYRWGLDRFIEEAQTLAKFNHPHIVRVYRYFRTNNTGYMVLHFEEGQSFKNWLKGLGRAPRQKELDAIISPLLEALDIIHSRDFLHRDIAPDNIIIRKDGSPVLIDFGSARCDIAAQSKTVSALVKPGYSPYEQYAETSRQQGPWTDIYALGATLYHAATGKRPPDAPSRMVNDEYRPAREAAISSYRSRFLNAIDSALRLNIDDRPQSIGAWRGELLAPDPTAQKPARQGWLTRRKKKKEEDAASALPEDIAVSHVEAPAAAATNSVPPPPDAPGPKGGLVNFMDGLKGRPPKSEPLADALARVQPPSPDDARNKPAARLGESATSAPLDASPHARTQRFDPNDLPPARARGGFFGLKKRREPDLRVKPERAVHDPKPDAPSETPESNERQARQEKNALTPVVVEPRRPARPRPMPSQSRSGWTSFVAKVAAAAGIVGILIASQDKLPKIDVAAWLEKLQPAPSNTSTAKRRSSSKIETAAINKRRSKSPSRATTAPAPPPPRINPLLRQTVAHERPATAMTFGANGQTVITASKDQTLKIWDAPTGGLRKTLTLMPAPVTAIATQGRFVAAGHENGLIEIFNLDSGLQVASMQRNEAPIWSLAFTNKTGRLAAASHDWTVTLWDLSRPKTPVHILEGHENAVQALASAPGRPYLATGGADKRVKLWNLDTLDLVRTYPRQNDFITAIAFSPDGQQFAAATLKGEIGIWSTKSRRRLKRMRGHKGAVKDLSFSPDGRLLTSAGSDGTVRIWSVKRGRTIQTLASHPGSVSAVGFSPDGTRLASVGDDGRLRLWSTSAATRTH